MRLSELKTGESAVIVKILGHGAFRKRVMEMGFTKGRHIKALLSAPLRDPVKYSLMNYEVSLRRAEASLIEIIPVDGEGKSPLDMNPSTATTEEHEPSDSPLRDDYTGHRH